MGIGPVGSISLAVALFASAAGGPRDSGYLRGVHYFGDAWPVNFWDSFRPAGARSDFATIRADGFDTIVLVVPWGQFQPSLKPPRYDETAFSRLESLVRTAATAQLRVALRLGYEWDFAPGVELPRDRFTRVFTDADVHAAWLDFLGEVWRRVGAEPNLVIGFFSWEDFWSFGGVTRLDAAGRLAAARGTGFRDWLRAGHRLASVAKAYGSQFASWEEVPVPEERKPGYELFLAFMDHLLTESLFKPGQQRFPKLSMEVRSDQDPVFAKDGRVTWVPHYPTFDLPGAPLTVTYYSVSMGAAERELSADRTLALMRDMLSTVKHNARSSLFIDQFVPYDNTPAFETNPKVKPTELRRFIEGAGPVLRELTAGYALWAWRDYESSALYNARFDLGLQGWEVAGGARLVASPEGDRELLLPRGARASQHISHQRMSVATFEAFSTARVCFQARSRSGTAIVAVRFAGDEKTEEVSTSARHCLELPRRDEGSLSITSRRGAALVSDVRFFAFVGSGKVRGTDGAPLELLTSVRGMNALLAGATIAEQYDRASVSQLTGVFADAWMGRAASGTLRVPQELKGRRFRLVTFLPGDWPEEPTLEVRIGAARLHGVCRRGRAVLEVAAEQLGVAPGTVARVEVTSDSSIVPHERGRNADLRALGCQLLELGFMPAH